MRKNRSQLDRDPRITAPLVSWKFLLSANLVVVGILVSAGFIYDRFLGRIDTLALILIYYTIIICLLIAVFAGLFWRRIIGKPLRKISRGARKVAEGDFSVQIEVTPRKTDEKNEIDVLIDDFNTMTKQLHGNEMLKNDFIANVSHEMKTPLSVIMSYSKALKDNRVCKQEEEKYLEVIIETSQKLNDMVSNILKISKLENQEIVPDKQPYELGEQLRKCSLAFMEKWQEKDIDFSIDVQDVSINSDKSLTDLLWNNLLSNAIKFTGQGGKITLTSEVMGDRVIVKISDNGCGMDERTKERIYEKFYQGDTSHSSQGNGLGLALAKKVVDLVGGDIRVESEPQKGSTFTVTLQR